MTDKPHHEMIVQLVSVDGGVLALTNAGRMFFRELDNRNFDPRNPRKYVWKEQTGPTF